MHEDETVEFWLSFPHEDLAQRCAGLHKYRREVEAKRLPEQVEVARRAVSEMFVRGRGIEVGAATRPFPVGNGAQVLYGDIRDAEQLKVYFGQKVADQGFIDAQTFRGVADESQDFVISAHVIEHLHDPIGSIVQAMRVLRRGGVHVLVVPDMRFTFDVDRPETDLDHLIADSLDGGTGTLGQAYREHMLYVHPRMGGDPVPLDEIETHVERGLANKPDIHVHTWTDVSLLRMLEYVSGLVSFEIAFSMPVGNENIVVMRKR